jgi:hypothetical protein
MGLTCMIRQGGLASSPVAASALSGSPWGQVSLGSGPATDLRALIYLQPERMARRSLLRAI